MIRSVNLNGFTPEARARRTRKAFSAESLIATMRALGMTDDEIRAALLKMKTERDADSKQETVTP